MFYSCSYYKFISEIPEHVQRNRLKDIHYSHLDANKRISIFSFQRNGFMWALFFCFLIISKQGLAVESVSVNNDLLTLASAVTQAVRDNPNLAKMQARWKAMSAIPSQLGTLPDPTISFGSLNLPTNTFNTTQEPMTQMQMGVNQSIPFPGKLGLREKAAEFEAEAASNDIDETRLSTSNSRCENNLVGSVLSGSCFRNCYSEQRALASIYRNCSNQIFGRKWIAARCVARTT